MLLGARQFFAARKAAPAWTNPYVIDGLVAMWDGEWNAGGGVHEDSPTEIADLVGNSPLSVVATQSNSVIFGSNFFAPHNVRGGFVRNQTTDVLKSAIDANSMTIEICATLTGYSGGAGWFYSDDSTQLYSSGNYVARWLRICGSLVNVSSASPSSTDSATIAIRIGGGDSAYFLNGIRSVSVSKGTSTCPVGIEIARSMAGMMHVHCVRISSALTDAQIAANYAIDKARFNLP